MTPGNRSKGLPRRPRVPRERFQTLTVRLAGGGCSRGCNQPWAKAKVRLQHLSEARTAAALAVTGKLSATNRRRSPLRTCLGSVTFDGDDQRTRLWRLVAD